ncbi:MAG TPA: DMT family transporter [Thermomicrobiales bacterium]
MAATTGLGRHRRAFACLVGTGVIWGTIGVAAKLLYRHTDLDAVTVTWLRALIASPIYLLLARRALGSDLFRASRRDRGIMVGLGVILIVYQWLYLAAVARLGVSSATLISLCVPPVLVAIASVAFLGERLNERTIAALVGALVGTALLVGSQSGGGEGNGSTTVGVLLALGCAAGIACHVLVSRSLAGRHHALRPLAIGFPSGVIAFTPLLAGHDLTLRVPVSGWFLLLYLGIVPSVVAYWLYQRGLQDLPATTASIVTLLEPLIAAVLAWAIFDERLGALGWIGGVLLMGSIVVLSLGSPAAVQQTAEDVALA